MQRQPLLRSISGRPRKRNQYCGAKPHAQHFDFAFKIAAAPRQLSVFALEFVGTQAFQVDSVTAPAAQCHRKRVVSGDIEVFAVQVDGGSLVAQRDGQVAVGVEDGGQAAAAVGAVIRWSVPRRNWATSRAAQNDCIAAMYFSCSTLASTTCGARTTQRREHRE